MAWSEKAIEDALCAYEGENWKEQFFLDCHDERRNKMRAALGAAAAVDSDAQWNEAIEAAARSAEGSACQTSGDKRRADAIAAAIRSLKRG